MSQAEADHLRGIVRIRAPGCGEVVVHLDEIVDRALAMMCREVSGGEKL